jgi:ribosomal protein L11 methyltransferase
VKVWTEVTARLAEIPEDWARYAYVFERHGLPGTVQTDRPPTLSAYVPPGEQVDLEALARDLKAQGASEVETREVEEEDWSETWRSYFKPIRIGERFVIRPTWEEFDAKPEDVVLVLDPGQAFGTGEHPTTRMCLELMEKIPLEGKTVADVGCGSGILSIAAIKLGATYAWGTDVDANAVEVSKENAERNGVEIDVHVGAGFMQGAGTDSYPLAEVTGLEGANWTNDTRYVHAEKAGSERDGQEIEAEFDLIISNIISAAVIRLTPSVQAHLKPGGKWIVSGIIEDNWPDVLQVVEANGFKFIEKKGEGDWVAATLSR